MLLRIMVHNDREIPMMLTVARDKHRVNNVDKSYRLEPAEAKMVEIDVPDGYSPYLKIWETNVALLSVIQSDVV